MVLLVVEVEFWLVVIFFLDSLRVSPQVSTWWGRIMPIGRTCANQSINQPIKLSWAHLFFVLILRFTSENGSNINIILVGASKRLPVCHKIEDTPHSKACVSCKHAHKYTARVTRTDPTLRASCSPPSAQENQTEKLRSNYNWTSFPAHPLALSAQQTKGPRCLKREKS